MTAVEDLPTTPCLLVDIDKVTQNVSRMTERCRRLNITLRPHMKTHKTLELAELMTSGKKRCIVVSTLQEAEFYADGGYDDIVYAYPLTADKLSRCKALTERLEAFHILIDNSILLDALSDIQLDGKEWSVFIAVDCGYGREGVFWEDIQTLGNLAKRLTDDQTTIFRGLYTHDGQSYYSQSPNEIRSKSGEAAHRMASVAEQLLEKFGIQCPTVGLGSTPSCSEPGNMDKITEFHPGNYVFYDLQQRKTGSCSTGDIACKVATRVICHNKKNNLMLVDCGWTGVSLDGQSANGFDLEFEGEPNLRMVGMTQEAGKVQAISGQLDFSKYPIGTILYVFPWHSCATASMHPVYYVHSGSKVLKTIKPTKGW